MSKFVKEKSGACRCTQCGAVIAARNCDWLNANCCESGLITSGVMGLGDYTESLLKSVGITPDRYVEAKIRFGLAPTCSCDARKEWLNKVGKWFGVG